MAASRLPATVLSVSVSASFDWESVILSTSFSQETDEVGFSVEELLLLAIAAIMPSANSTVRIIFIGLLNFLYFHMRNKPTGKQQQNIIRTINQVCE